MRTAKRNMIKKSRRFSCFFCLILVLMLFSSCGTSVGSGSGQIVSDKETTVSDTVPENSPESIQNGQEQPVSQTMVTQIDITFDYNHMSTMASNQYAVWVEDGDGNIVKTLFATDFTAYERGYKKREETASRRI